MCILGSRRWVTPGILTLSLLLTSAGSVRADPPLAPAKTAQEYTKQIDSFNKLLMEANNKIVDLGLEKDRALTEIVQLKDKIDELKKRSKLPAVQPADSLKHALILDISTGKPLWDESLGKIMSVEGKKVVINLGSADGVRPGLTFHIFAGTDNHSRSGKGVNPHTRLKGTIEVLRKIEEHTAEALITEPFDAKNNPIQEDDLLYNMFWKTHVVVAGQIDWFGLVGTRAETVSDEVRNLDQFRALLKSQGVIVDAYVDLADGSIKGKVSPQARFLIHGQLPYQPKFIAPEESEAHKKLAELNRKRISDINDGIKKLRAECVEEGLFIISAANFAHVAGIQKRRATNGPEPRPFRPPLPGADARKRNEEPVPPPAAKNADAQPGFVHGKESRPSKLTAQEIELYRALNSTKSVVFENLPLRKVFDYFEDSTKGALTITIDVALLEPDLKRVFDEPVSFRAKKLPIRTTLRKILGDKNLSYYVNDGIVIVAPKFSESLEVRLYNIAGVLDSKNLKRGQAELRKALRLVAPGTWDDEGKTADVPSVMFFAHKDLLLVRQTRTMHEQIRRLLVELGAPRPNAKVDLSGVDLDAENAAARLQRFSE